MGITYEPSLAQQLGPEAINSIAEGINHFVNPNYRFEQAMRVAVAKDPKLLQTLADQEHANPGFLKKMGLPKLSEAMQGIPESPEGQYIRENRETILGNQTTKLKTDTQKAKNEGTIQGSVSDYLANNPGAATDVARVAIGLPTQVKERQEEAAATSAEGQAKINQLLGDNASTLAGAEVSRAAATQTQYDLAKKQYEDILTSYPALQGTDPMQVYNDIAKGKPVPDLNKLFMVDGFAKAFGGVTTIKDLQAKLAENLEAVNARISAQKDRKQDQTDRTLEAHALSDFSKSRAGSPQAWIEYYKNPNAIDEIKAKQAAGQTLLPHDRELLEIGDWLKDTAKEDQDKRQGVIIKGINDELLKQRTGLDKAIKAGSMPDIQAALGTYNTALQSKNKLTGRNIIAQYGKPADLHASVLRKNRLYFTEGGQHVPDEKANDYIGSETNNTEQQPTQAGDVKVSSGAQTVLDAWNKATPAQKAVMRSKYRDTDEFKELTSKGLLK